MTRPKPATNILAILLVALLFIPLGQAHVGPHPSVHDTVAGILNRFKATLSTEEIVSMNLAKAKSLLTKEERHILAHKHLSLIHI